MGFCSGTSIFDDVFEKVMTSKIDDDLRFMVMYTLAKSLENHDWDCQNDSIFAGTAMWNKVMLALHPDWDWLVGAEDKVIY